MAAMSSMLRFVLIGLLSVGVAAAAHAEQATSRFPRAVKTIPPAFRGRWDELQSDKCRDREARYTLEARHLSEFEVFWDVQRVKLVSPTEIEIFTTLKDEDGRRANEVWDFRLVEGGKGLTGRRVRKPIFRRCPSETD